MNAHGLHKRRFLQLGLALCALPAWAQQYPNRLLTLMVPYPAGGGSDFLARQLQPELSKQLGQQVVVENTGGASGAIGIQKVIAAPADGYQLLLGSPMEIMLTPLALSAVKYKPEDLRPVAQLVTMTMVLLTRKDLPVRDVQDLVALGRQQELSFGSLGHASLYHLVAARFMQLTGTKMLHVPYKGMVPVLADLMGGQIDLAFIPLNGNVPSLIREGRVKALGITARHAVASFPELEPLAAREAFAGLEFDIWGGIQVARATPIDVAKRLNQAVYQSLQNPGIRTAYEAAGNTLPAPMSLEELDRLYHEENRRYQTIAKSVSLESP